MKNKKKAMILMTLIICIASTIPSIVQIVNTTKHLNKLSNTLGTQQDTLVKLQNQVRESEKLYNDVKDIKSTLGYDVQDGRFIVKLADRLNSEGVVLNNYQASEIEVYNNIMALPINMELEGSYTSIIDIIDYLENSEIFVQIQEPSFVASNRNSRESANIYNGQTVCKMQLVLYSTTGKREQLAFEGYRDWTFGKVNPFIK